MSPSTAEHELVHGTALALGDKAVLIRGPSGSGKSDLALRCLAQGPFAHISYRMELVADDQVHLVRSERGIEVSAPPTIAGKMEMRGLGILSLPYRASAVLKLVVDLVSVSDVPRYPLDEVSTEFLGAEIPVIRLAPFEASAPIKVLLALNEATAH